jgi:hypothetical protein
MDWKYKHFQGERIYAEQRDEVIEAARRFMAESLRWQVTNTADGLRAEGYSFSHRAIANLQIQSGGGTSSESGTKVAVELLVARASSRGFMLFDVGGYYDIQIRKWLAGIQWSLQQQLTGSNDQSTNPLVLADNKTSAHILNGCLVFICVIFALYFLGTFIGAVVGLLSGNLLLLGRGSLVIHGIWARILSASILLFGALLAWRIKRKAWR